MNTSIFNEEFTGYLGVVVTPKRLLLAVGAGAVTWMVFGALFRPDGSLVAATVSKRASVGDPDHDVPHEKIMEIADRSLDGPPEKAANFKLHRPRHNRAYVSKAPQVGDKAPDGMLHLMSGGATTLHKQLEELSFQRPNDAPPHVAVVFGNRTCPVWTDVTAKLAITSFGAQGIPTIQIYTKEANPSDTFPNQSNTDCNVVINQHATLEDRLTAAATAIEELQRQVHGSHPVLMGVDGMDNQLEVKYETIPNRLYVINTTDMTVSYASNFGPLNPAGKVKDGVASVIKQ